VSATGEGKADRESLRVLRVTVNAAGVREVSIVKNERNGTERLTGRFVKRYNL
jgi:hypothetical protein